ncbi:glucose-6-phosphate 1-dehydrogenase [bacterium BMS3Abin04]|nr:glucose-6-phosphate 1-dehydrogenase [bacterium BMS3Abin04]
MTKTESQVLVIFGASGDLTKRKLLPALYDLYKQNMLPQFFAILGVSRTNYTDFQFRDKMHSSIIDYGKYGIEDVSKIKKFVNNVFYQPIDTNSPEAYGELKNRLKKLTDKLGIRSNFIYYLSTPPSLYGTIPQFLAERGLNKQENGWKRLIVEKPFGYNLESALDLNKKLLSNWEEDQIYRIDHYLGKETVQNLLVTRFSNGIFEPLWNRNYVHHVEVTGAESIGVENRGGYYEGSGALRDMIQNHLLQVVSLVAMEPPSSIDSTAIRNETLKVFQSLRRIKEEEVKNVTIRGQYTSSVIKDEKILGYREEKGVNLNSKTETYAAVKFYIDNWRWGGVPFYVRTGKRLPTRVSEVVLHFKPTPHYLFSQTEVCDSCNQLVIRIQPDEGILIKFGMKIPGAGFEVKNVNMDFHYSDLSNIRLPNAYERLLLDCMQGDSTLFARGDAVIEAWKFLAPVQKVWEHDPNMPIYGYPAGTWGPEYADGLIQEKEMTWRYPCKNLTGDGLYCEL